MVQEILENVKAEIIRLANEELSREGRNILFEDEAVDLFMRLTDPKEGSKALREYIIREVTEALDYDDMAREIIYED